ncbi:UNVERIFIED_CONTAM: hypothetical protein ABIC26_002734 [Paenibacillus sp. PvR008]
MNVMENDLLSVTDLDTIVVYIRMCYNNENWEMLEKLSDHLSNCTYDEIKYNKDQQDIHTKNKTKSPLVYYYGYGHLMKGIALQKMKKYSESAVCINNYSELGWFDGLDEEGKAIVKDFKFNAKANRYTLEVLKGNKAVINEYIDYLENDPAEYLPAYITILEAALDYNWDVDHYLNKLSTRASWLSDFEDSANINYYVNYMYHLALYNFCKERFSDALHSVIKALQSSVKIREGKFFLKCVALFELHRNFATSEQIKTYVDFLTIILEGEFKNEKNIALIDNRIRPI